MNAKECDWANKNQILQKELRETLRSALQDTEREEHSLTSLEQVNTILYHKVRDNIHQCITHPCLDNSQNISVIPAFR